MGLLAFPTHVQRGHTAILLPGWFLPPRTQTRPATTVAEWPYTSCLRGGVVVAVLRGHKSGFLLGLKGVMYRGLGKDNKAFERERERDRGRARERERERYIYIYIIYIYIYIYTHTYGAISR